MIYDTTKTLTSYCYWFSSFEFVISTLDARVDPEDMGCGQRCFFTYGQMCQRISEALNCCMTDYEEAMQKEVCLPNHNTNFSAL